MPLTTQLFTVIFVSCCSVISLDSYAQWTQTNGPYTANVNAFTTVGNTIFAACTSGTFKSTDNGIEWSSINIPVPMGHPIVAIGSVLFEAGYGGLFRSFDEGQTWDTVTNGDLTNVTSLATVGATVLAVMNTHLYLSHDTGEHWSQVMAGGGPFTTADGNVIFSTFGIGAQSNLYRSTDTGKSWVPIGSGLLKIDRQLSGISSIVAFGNNILIGTDDGVFCSTDIGATWILADTSLRDRFVVTMGLQGSVLYASKFSGLYRSIDTGKTWLQFVNDLGDVDINTLFTRQDQLFAGTSGGVFASTDSGSHWQMLNEGILGNTINTLQRKEKSVYAGTSGGGVFKMDSTRGQWVVLNRGLTNEYIQAFAIADSLMYSGTAGDYNGNAYENGGMFISHDEGANWAASNIGLPNRIIYSIALSDSLEFVATDRGVARSSDHGTSWLPVNNGLPHYDSNPLSVNTVAFQWGTVLAGSQGWVFTSSDHGDSWSRSTGGTSSTIDAFAFTQSKAFVGMEAGVYQSSDTGKTWSSAGLKNEIIFSLLANDSLLFAGTLHGVYFSSSDGLSWTNISQGLSDTSIHSLTLIDDTLYCGTETRGVWRRPLSEMIGANAVTEKPAPKQAFCIYPNPTASSTTISLTPEASGYAEISIVNKLGQVVARVYSGVLDPSEHTFMWQAQAKAGAPGVYECVVRMNGKTQTLPIVVE